MRLSELKETLKGLEEIRFILPNGTFVPVHFHVTEVGMITKKFIDCGGTIREENKVNFQLWEADDFDHRLGAEKLIKIIELSEKQIGIEDREIEVEYQSDTIGKYGLSFDGINFLLTSTQTNCLAPDKCGVPVVKEKVSLSDLGNSQACTPGSGCC